MYLYDIVQEQDKYKHTHTHTTMQKKETVEEKRHKTVSDTKYALMSPKARQG